MAKNVIERWIFNYRYYTFSVYKGRIWCYDVQRNLVNDGSQATPFKMFSCS